MKRWKMIAGSVAAAALVTGNIYLTFKEDSKVQRSTWLKDWAFVTKEDVVESFQTTGVITPAEEYPIYFDGNLGTFQQFLVKEGERVNPGSRLFDYSSAEIEEEKEELEAEKSKVQSEITLVEKHISTLRRLKKDLPKTNSKENENDEELSAAVTLDSEISEQEMEKQKLEEESKKYDNLIQKLDSKKIRLSVTSSYEGYIKEINKNLQNPILTIRSALPAIQGSLTEKQLKKVKEGLKVEITTDMTDKRLEGAIQHVSLYPDSQPSVKKKSYYPFTISLDEAQLAELNEELTPGIKANMKVITSEALSTPTVPTNSVLHEGKKEYILLLTKKGEIKKQEIETGIRVKDDQTIIMGAKKGDAFITAPQDIRLTDVPFITPLNTNLLDDKSFDQMRKKEKLKNFLLGLL